MPKKWFQNWFNSPYYHILYHQRNDAEAEFFIDTLCLHLRPEQHARLLDIACGRGRHAIYLQKKGYEVTGIDLSVSNVQFARQFENPRLHFYVHDMRHLFYINYFDIAFNLFTSFGYFETEKEHINALKTFRKALKNGGIMVLDYFNSFKIMNNLTHRETKEIDGIEFHIHKKVEGLNIIKAIEFEHKNKQFAFKEEVKAFTVDDFKRLFSASGFEVIDSFGNYALEPFDRAHSDRLIFVCRKAYV